MKGRRHLFLLHAMGWLVFITLPVMVLPRPRFLPQDVGLDMVLLVLGITTLPLMGLFYFHLLYALPKFYLTKRYFLYGCLVALGVMVMLAFPEVLYQSLSRMQDVFGHQPTLVRRGTAYRSVVILVVSFSLFAYQRWRLAETAKAQAELAYLKAQINPHFLFNTLNSIYYLTLQRSEGAPIAVEKLSAIMRYVIDEGDHDWVPLDREVGYLRDYIALQKLRFTDNVRIHLDVTGDLAGKHIAPLLLVSFVENAFKHGISMEEDSPIGITLAVSSDHIRFTVRNRKFGGYAGSPPEPGIGMENTRRRLALAYPGRHRLEVKETVAEYVVQLSIGDSQAGHDPS